MDPHRDAAAPAREGRLEWHRILAKKGWVTQQSIQLHGGVGITEEHDVGLYFKRMQALDALFGDEEHHVRRFADQAMPRAARA